MQETSDAAGKVGSGCFARMFGIVRSSPVLCGLGRAHARLFKVAGTGVRDAISANALPGLNLSP